MGNPDAVRLGPWEQRDDKSWVQRRKSTMMGFAELVMKHEGSRE